MAVKKVLKVDLVENEEKVVTGGEPTPQNETALEEEETAVEETAEVETETETESVEVSLEEETVVEESQDKVEEILVNNETPIDRSKEESTIDFQQAEQRENPVFTVDVTPTEEPHMEVTVDETPINEDTLPEKLFRVRMREDHRCFVGDELYDLKAGLEYRVPDSVKRRLNKRGLLLPI